MIQYIRQAITTNGGTPQSFSVTGALRELVTSYGGTPTQYSVVGLLREAVSAKGGTPTQYTVVGLLRELLAALSVTPTSFDERALWALVGSSGGGAAVPVYLPTLSAAPLAAYGAQKLVSGYSGALFQLVRASDSTTLDVSPASGSVLPDYSAITTWAGGSALTVSIVYDQSGGGLNLTQTTAALRPAFVPTRLFNSVAPILVNGVNRGTTVAKSLTIPAGVSISRQNYTEMLVVRPQVSFEQCAYIEASSNSRSVYTNGTKTGSGSIFVRDGTLGRPATGRAVPRVQPVIIGANGTASGAVIHLDLETTAIATQAAGTSAGGGLGVSVGGGAAYNGMFELFGYVVYASGSVDTSALKTALNSAFGVNISPNLPVVVYDGHSGPEGYGNTFVNPVARQTEALLTQPVRLYDTAVFGSSISEISGAFAGRVVPLYNSSASRNIVIIADVSNSLLTDTAASALTALQGYCSAARTAGFKVIVSTVKPRADAVANFISVQPTFNTNLRSTWATFADGLADYAGNATIGGDGVGTGITNNTTYWFDGIHLTSAGQGIAAAIDAAVINGLLA